MKRVLSSVGTAVLLTISTYATAASVTAAVGGPKVVIGSAEGLILRSGSSDLAFSQGTDFDINNPSAIGGAVGAMNVAKLSVTSLGDAVAQPMYVPDPPFDDVRVGVTISSRADAVTLDDVSGQFTTLSSVGGVKVTGTPIQGIMNGGTVSATNLRIDLASKTVVADVVGRNDAFGTKPAVDYVLPNAPLWTFDTISGPTALKPEYLMGQDPLGALRAAGFEASGTPGTPGGYVSVQVQHGYPGYCSSYDPYGGCNNFVPPYSYWTTEQVWDPTIPAGPASLVITATNTVSGLTMTQTGLGIFAKSLGLLSAGTATLGGVNGDGGWGTLTATTVFASAVPEPSTYALMGLGLVGVALAARRRA